MRVDQDTVVTLNYVLKDDQGKVMQSSEIDAPIEFIVGQGMVLSGLEEAVLGRQMGEKLEVTLSPEQAYGLHDPRKVQVLPSDYFGNEAVSVGDQFHINTGSMNEILKVIDVKEDRIVIDYNSMLAGARLNFSLHITQLRKATKLELKNGLDIEDPCGKTNKIPLVQS
ncbi:MAG: peptidylprolyl isomerase [Moraxellaceae bacterium]|nr:MAG: peptidylprolyl isomerase [Moraxellaceae bacterium]